MGCGAAHNFTLLALARVGVGVGEAGGSPPSYSIIADYFPPQRRGSAMAIYSLGVPLGTTAGAALGGWIASAFGWRSAFIAIGLFGLVYSLIILAAVREPVRGKFDASPGKPEPLGQTLRLFMQDRTLRLTALAAGLSAFFRLRDAQLDSRPVDAHQRHEPGRTGHLLQPGVGRGGDGRYAA